MEHEILERRKRIKDNVIIFVLAASILLNLYQYSVSRNYTKTQESNATTLFHLISIHAGVLNERIDLFINYMNEQDDNSNGAHDKTLARIHHNWRIIIGERESLNLYQGVVAHVYLDELEEWQLVELILRRANLEIFTLTLKFLEQGYYSLDQEGIEGLRVASEIYQIISRVIVTEPELSLESNLVDSLLEPLQRLDEHYYNNFLQLREEVTQ